MSIGVEMADVGATEAIGMSIRQDRIVRIVDPTGSQSVVLDEMSEDGVRNGDEYEYWGTYEGSEWRVHVDTAAR